MVKKKRKTYTFYWFLNNIYIVLNYIYWFKSMLKSIVMCLNECANELLIKSSSWRYKVATKLRSELMIIRMVQRWQSILFWCWSFQVGCVQVSVEAVDRVDRRLCVRVNLMRTSNCHLNTNRTSTQREKIDAWQPSIFTDKRQHRVSWSWSPSKTFQMFFFPDGIIFF